MEPPVPMGPTPTIIDESASRITLTRTKVEDTLHRRGDPNRPCFLSALMSDHVGWARKLGVGLFG